MPRYTEKKWGVLTVAHNDTDFLEATLRMFQPFVDKIVVSTGQKSWMGDVENDGEVEKVVLPLTEQFENINLVKGNWKTETEQRNETLRHLGECDFIFIVDADEMWASGDIDNTKTFILNHPGYVIFRANWNTRFRSLGWRVEPREPFKPIVVIGRGIKFAENREVEPTPETRGILIPEKTALIEHLSYVRADNEKIKEKIKTFSHANQIVGGADFWYSEVYLQADLNSKNIHPTHPLAYQGLIEDSIHPEIKRFLKDYSPLVVL